MPPLSASAESVIDVYGGAPLPLSKSKMKASPPLRWVLSLSNAVIDSGWLESKEGQIPLPHTKKDIPAKLTFSDKKEGPTTSISLRIHPPFHSDRLFEGLNPKPLIYVPPFKKFYSIESATVVRSASMLSLHNNSRILVTNYKPEKESSIDKKFRRQARNGAKVVTLTSLKESSSMGSFFQSQSIPGHKKSQDASDTKQKRLKYDTNFGADVSTSGILKERYVEQLDFNHDYSEPLLCEGNGRVLSWRKGTPQFSICYEGDGIYVTAPSGQITPSFPNPSSSSWINGLLLFADNADTLKFAGARCYIEDTSYLPNDEWKTINCSGDTTDIYIGSADSETIKKALTKSPQALVLAPLVNIEELLKRTLESTGKETSRFSDYSEYRHEKREIRIGVWNPTGINEIDRWRLMEILTSWGIERRAPLANIHP
ncbi:MAG: hypothetical protein JKX97_03415 [Candidatus Lindowbacteria bacterium]|nr:hypothetical protein [Candidatus Lindowbacteria bacterium]